MRSLETDCLVVGAGAMGMAFTDALIDHADVHVTLVDRRHAAGGHWLDPYPFVRLHQASLFYGVASTVLGRGAVQLSGPEAGLQEQARQSEIRVCYGPGRCRPARAPQAANPANTTRREENALADDPLDPGLGLPALGSGLGVHRPPRVCETAS
jgi:NAD(P)-binding Rossmann-like domain